MKKSMTKEEIEARVEEFETKRRALVDKIDDRSHSVGSLV